MSIGLQGNLLTLSSGVGDTFGGAMIAAANVKAGNATRTVNGAAMALASNLSGVQMDCSQAWRYLEANAGSMV